jgi:3-oxoacyl-[acyl-carrier protein] reductase
MPQDTYSQLVNSRIGSLIAGPVGLPQPVELDRYSPGRPVIAGEVLLGAASGSRLVGPIAGVLSSVGAAVRTELRDEVRDAVGEVGLDAAVWNPEAPTEARFASSSSRPSAGLRGRAA